MKGLVSHFRNVDDLSTDVGHCRQIWIERPDNRQELRPHPIWPRVTDLLAENQHPRPKKSGRNGLKRIDVTATLATIRDPLRFQAEAAFFDK